MTIPRSVIENAFPGQPRMQAAFATLVGDAEDAINRLNTAVAAIGDLSGTTEGIAADLAKKQPKNDTLTAIAAVAADPGVIEQLGAGMIAIRPIDAADKKSLLTRAVADSRYLGANKPAASLANREFGMSLVGLPGIPAGATILRFVFEQAITFAGGAANAADAATGSVVLPFFNNGTAAGTITLSGTTGTIAYTAAAFTVGSVFELRQASSPNTTLDRVSITLTT